MTVFGDLEISTLDRAAGRALADRHHVVPDRGEAALPRAGLAAGPRGGRGRPPGLRRLPADRRRRAPTTDADGETPTCRRARRRRAAGRSPCSTSPPMLRRRPAGRAAGRGAARPAAGRREGRRDARASPPARSTCWWPPPSSRSASTCPTPPRWWSWTPTGSASPSCTSCAAGSAAGSAPGCACWSPRRRAGYAGPGAAGRGRRHPGRVRALPARPRDSAARATCSAQRSPAAGPACGCCPSLRRRGGHRDGPRGGHRRSSTADPTLADAPRAARRRSPRCSPTRARRVPGEGLTVAGERVTRIIAGAAARPAARRTAGRAAPGPPPTGPARRCSRTSAVAAPAPGRAARSSTCTPAPARSGWRRSPGRRRSRCWSSPTPRRLARSGANVARWGCRGAEVRPGRAERVVRSAAAAAGRPVRRGLRRPALRRCRPTSSREVLLDTGRPRLARGRRRRRGRAGHPRRRPGRGRPASSGLRSRRYGEATLWYGRAAPVPAADPTSDQRGGPT